MNWRAINRLSLYLVIAGCSFGLANLKAEMNQFEQTLFAIGLVLNLATVCRSFMDSSNEKPMAKPVQIQKEIVEYPAVVNNPDEPEL